MSSSTVLLLAFAIGIVAGLRAFTAPAVVAWAASRQWIHLHVTPLAFMGSTVAVIIFTLLAVAELITDQLPKTPSRKAPPGFIARIVTGGVSGAAIGASSGSWAVGLVAGVIGAVAGTLGGYELRVRLVKATGGKDLPIALLEDAIAIGGGFLIVSRFS